MLNRLSWPRRLLLAGMLSALAGIGWLLYWLVFGSAEAMDLPPLAESKFLNTQAAALYVGSQQCADCHTDQHSSYLQTTHCRTILPIDAQDAPEDADFDHPGSLRRYRVYRRDGELRHAEIASLPGAGEFPLGDHALRLAIGSGKVGSSYTALLDGFMVQSPISWYTTRKQWDVSPGSSYEGPGSLSFGRPVGEGCWFCHAGRVEYPQGGLRNLTFHEQAIGCERCHGPGSLHVERRTSGESSAGDEDLTIVHPGRLTRDRLEAVCGQCHLDTAAHVGLRGRRIEDFRPGQRLEDYRIYFGLSSGHGALRVTSHIQQLRESRCYQRDDKLTCSTCHEVHGRKRPEALLDYRVKCLECHSAQACRLGEGERRQRQEDDNCLVCHMPRNAIEVPHVAFTNHRIGIHRGPPEAHEEPQALALEPWSDVSELPKIEVDRGLGLAYHRLATSMGGEARKSGLERAKDILLAVRRRGMRDAEVDWTLADIFQRERDGDRAFVLAESAMSQEANLKAVARARTLYILSLNYLERGQRREAESALEKLVAICPMAEAYYNLALLRRDAGNVPAALEAAQHAADLAPFGPQHHRLLAELCQRLGQTAQAAEHARLEAALMRLRRQPGAPTVGP